MQSHVAKWVGVFVFLGSAVAASNATAAPDGMLRNFVRIEASDLAKFNKLGIVPKTAIDYGSFSWLELAASDHARLQLSDIAFQDESDGYILDLGGVKFDPAVAAPAAPAGWAQPRSGGKALQLVQFVAPTKAEWVRQVQDSNLQVVQYIHPFTYIVYGDVAALAAPRAANHVRWTGAFEPAFKVQPQWRSLGTDVIETKMLLIRGADCDAAIQALTAMGAKIAGRTPINDTFESVTLGLAGSLYRDAAMLPAVYMVKPAPTDGGLRGEMSNQVNANNVDGTNLAFPGYVAWLGSVGVNGAGVVIANVDGGVQETHADLVNRFLACSGTTCSGTSSSHGTHTAGIMAADGSSGVMANGGFLRGLGVAPGANLVEQVYSPHFQNPGGMLLLMKDSFNNSASVSGNSWGPAGSPLGYDDDTMQCDIGVRDAVDTTAGNQQLNFVLSFMNGNGGTSTQGTPDEGKNLFTIGSTKMQSSGSGNQILQIDDLSSNSAHGPALDGRTIPHMVAPGCYVDSTITTSTHGLNCGTSMASPHVTGAVALFIQHYRGLPGYTVDPSPALVKAAHIAVARDLATHLDADGGILGHPFDSKQGWGRMDVEAVLDPTVAVRYFDNPVLLNDTGEQWTSTIAADDPSKPIKIMLVWTDAPGHGLGGATPAWNNDLNLTVEEGANIYKGNVFGGTGFSITGGVADNKNNTEGVFIGPTAPSAYTIKVTAANITSDGVPNTGDTTDQDFALACINCALEPGFTLAAAPTPQNICTPTSAVFNVDVGQVMGFTDPVTLSASGNPGGTTAIFGTNPVGTPGSTTLTIGNTGAAAPGQYDILVSGVSGAINRSTTVRLNVFTASPGAPTLLTPADSASNQALRPNFTWTPAAQSSTYDIQIATDAAFTTVVNSASGLASPAYTPGVDLALGTTHYWRVRAANICGTGPYSAPFSFVTRVFPQILLVDDDDNGPDVRATYTTALDALGRNYDIWNTANSDNEPSAAQLSPYKIVIWFTGDEFGGACGPGAAGEAALAAWLVTGKRLFMCSQDYLYDRDSPTGVPTAFMQTYLGMASPGQNDINQTSVTGQNFFAGLGPYALSYPFTNFSDRISPAVGASLAFSGNTGTPPEAAIYKDGGTYRTVFFGFPWEAIPAANRNAVMQRVLDWFAPSCPGQKGDMNASAAVNGDDSQSFVNCLIVGDPYASGCGCADMDSSGDYSANDVNLYVDCQVLGICP
jgi:hypothetical protein